MLHQPVTSFVPSPTYPILSIASPSDIDGAKAWIAAARKCGMVVAPWKDSVGPDALGCVMQTGQDEDGPNHWAAASDRFMKHPASKLRKELPKGLVYELLCQELDLHQTDPALCDKVNARLRVDDELRKERRLLQLCRRVDDILTDDERLENAFSDATDAFDKIEKPTRPDYGPFPSSYFQKGYREAAAELRAARATPKDQLGSWMLGLLVTGRFKAFVDDLKAYEVALGKLEETSGLAAARKASAAANKRSRAIIAEIASIKATSAAGVAAKCASMKRCLEAGWTLDDEFDQLANSIFVDGARLGETPLPVRPRRSEPAQPVHH